MQRFSPGTIAYDDRMSEAYVSGRSLSDEAASTWVAALEPFVARTERLRLLDLGAGTGRFSVPFARSFATTHIVAVEPSTSMLAVAVSGERPNNLAYIVGTAERIPLANRTCDLVWLSHVWHHIADRPSCVNELHRVLRRPGHVLVRGTFGDQLDGFPTLFRYWPGTEGICRQLPTIPETTRLFEAHGFSMREHRRVRQVTAASLDEFARRTRLRADTALRLIPDSEFQAGQTAIEAAAVQDHAPTPVFETIEFLVFGAPGPA
jgi:ubiquinone/menaquinone biosynthesis C-methylase UbiE